MRRLVVPLLLAAAIPSRLAAQSPQIPTPAPNVSLGFGVHYGSPMRTSGALGVLVDIDKKRNDGLVATFELGHEGDEVSAGYFRMFGRFGSGYSVRAALVRTGGEPWNASPHTSYVGVEAHWMLILGAGGRVGYLRRASRSETDPYDTIVSIGISIGS